MDTHWAVLGLDWVPGLRQENLERDMNILIKHIGTAHMKRCHQTAVCQYFMTELLFFLIEQTD